MFYIQSGLETERKFDMIKFFDFDYDNIDSLNNYISLILPKLPVQGTYQITSEIGRPDLISYNIYQDTQYWWLLLLYNNILDINDLQTGATILYPSLSSIEYMYERASVLDKTA